MILSWRNDDKFSQKVRNLLWSHFDTNPLGNLWLMQREGRNLPIILTSKWREYLQQNEENYISLYSAWFDDSQREEVIKKNYKWYVAEGWEYIANVKTKKRSSKLISFAKEKYRDQHGNFLCEACGFASFQYYWELWEWYIEMHHIRPIYLLEEESIDELESALKNVIPLCANCHRMVHRKRNAVLEINQLIDFIHSHWMFSGINNS